MLLKYRGITAYLLASVILVGCSGSDGDGNNENEVGTGSNQQESSSPENTENTNMPPAADDESEQNPVVATSSDPLQEGLIGPSGGSGNAGEYAQFNDSPFANLNFGDGYFYFEDFEDKVLEHPGAEPSDGDFVSIEFGETFNDSVDADDGLIDGNSLDGESWFHAVSTTGIVWSFNADELDGRLPTHVGIVWTDGRLETTFEAFDSSGLSLGTIVADHTNASFNGETDDDRFYGVVHYAGISAIKISNTNRLNGIEVDHLQWGYLPIELR